MIVYNTPIGKYGEIYVKREDLASPPPGPPFAKVRGLYKRLLILRSTGVEVVGYTETSISMAGWGVAHYAQKLGMTAVIFDPIYKKTPETLRFHRERWAEFSAVVVPIPAGMAKVNYYKSRKILRELYGPKAVMLPLGLPFWETIDAVASEFLLSGAFRFPTIVTCVGSGTMAAGILSGMVKAKAQTNLIGILCRPSKRIEDKRVSLLQGSGALFCGMAKNLKLLDLGYQYTDAVDFYSPFPCNPYYDKKAWKWVVENSADLEKPILFWNIGA